MLNIKKPNAQMTLEFTFCFVMVLLLLYGCIMAFRWAGMNLAERRIAHEETLTNSSIDENWSSYQESPLKQVGTDYFQGTGMNLVFNNWE